MSFCWASATLTSGGAGGRAPALARVQAARTKMMKIKTAISEARFINPSYASDKSNVLATLKPLNLLRSLTSVGRKSLVRSRRGSRNREASRDFVGTKFGRNAG